MDPPTPKKRQSTRIQRDADVPASTRATPEVDSVPGTDYTVTKVTNDAGRVFHIFEFSLRIEDIRFPTFEVETRRERGGKKKHKPTFALENGDFAKDDDGKHLPPREGSAHPLEEDWIRRVYKPWYESRVQAKDTDLKQLYDTSDLCITTIVCKASDFASDFLRVRFTNGPVTANMAVIAVNQVLSMPMTDAYYSDTTWSNDFDALKPAARGQLLGNHIWVERIDPVDRYGFFCELAEFERHGDPHHFIVLGS